MSSHARRLARLAIVNIVLFTCAGCATMTDLVAVPFDMASHVAVETVKLPYETAKLGAQGIVNAFAN